MSTHTINVSASDSIPTQCQVLIIGGGPAGSYAASVLAREAIDVVLLEADVFPRYHVGESMLASMRHFLRFIDLDKTFDAYGFTKKVGAAFKLNGQKREGFTDFLAAGGQENYAWNVVRSESDALMFVHARDKCGAKVFDGVRVKDVQFAALDPKQGDEDVQRKRPVSATWVRKQSHLSSPSPSEKETGQIRFTYLIDASGRSGLLSTRYIKNRTFNQSLKNVAFWGYWVNTGVYACGTTREGAPFFEALSDESGWAWLIPLHNGTTSVGVVMNQEIATAKKKTISPSPSSAREFYLEQLKLAPSLFAILHSPSPSPSKGNGNDQATVTATLVTPIKSASDYSYSAAKSRYSLPYARIVGDAGCFIDPYFSSGVHLALSSALSAAVTICASIRSIATTPGTSGCSASASVSFTSADSSNSGCGEGKKYGDEEGEKIDEERARKWHDRKVGVSYARFLLVVMSAYRQIRAQQEPVLSDFGEDNFDRAFKHFRPIIQGAADVNDNKIRVSQEELQKTLDFCAHAFEPALPEDRASVLQKLANLDLISDREESNFNSNSKPDPDPKSYPESTDSVGEALNLNEDERRILQHIRARKMMRTEDTMNIASFSTDVIDGLAPRLVKGSLGLQVVERMGA